MDDARARDPLTLNRLGARQAMAIVDRVAGGKALPAEVLEQILAKTDGVPLFVEELTKAVLELGLMREEGGRYVLAGPLPTMAIPSTLHGRSWPASTGWRPVKEVAQVGAVIGREFGHACSRPWRRCRKTGWRRRWRNSRPPSWSSVAACRPRRYTSSSTLWCRR